VISTNPYDKGALLKKKFEGFKFPSAEQIPYVLTSPESNKGFQNTPKILKYKPDMKVSTTSFGDVTTNASASISLSKIPSIPKPSGNGGP
jgi:hypothetical protein